MRNWLGLIVAIAALALAAQPASAVTKPKPGSACTMSGMAVTTGGKTYVCSSTSMTWGSGLPASSSSLRVQGAWIKAANEGMTGSFGTLVNPTGKPINVIAVQAKVSPWGQLHEVAMRDGSMVMQQKAGGFIVPANGTLELKPGGSHLMLMELRNPVKAGDMVSIVLTAADGSRLSYQAMGKVFSGGNEEYDGSTGHGGM